MNWIKKLISLIFEDICTLCLNSSNCIICKKCLNKISHFKFRGKKNISGVTVFIWGKYEGELRKLIIKLKNGEERLCGFFGNVLSEYLISLLNNFNCKDLEKIILISVPSHKKRINERGFCQTTLIAHEISSQTNIKHLTGIVIRDKKTKFMNNLKNIADRKENIKNAFKIVRGINQNIKTVILIDDILTSGSTIEEITRIILRSNKEIKIYGLVIASGDKLLSN